MGCAQCIHHFFCACDCTPDQIVHGLTGCCKVTGRFFLKRNIVLFLGILTVVLLITGMAINDPVLAHSTRTGQTPSVHRIQCNQYSTGYISSGETISWLFENKKIRTVSFSNCLSDFDSTMYLLDRSGNQIQTGCDGDDCGCGYSSNEEFTVHSLEEGTFNLTLGTYSGGGHFRVEVVCGDDTDSGIMFLTAMSFAMLFVVIGTVRIKWRYCCCKCRAFGWLAVGALCALAPIVIKLSLFRESILSIEPGDTMNCDIAAFCFITIMVVISWKLSRDENAVQDPVMQSKPMMEGLSQI